LVYRSIFKFFLSLAVFSGFCFFSSCNLGSEKPDIKSGYFNLKSYFSRKEKFFEKGHYRLTKTLAFEGKTQTIEVKNPEWIREMVFFQDADINKPAWKGLFKEEFKHGNLEYSDLDTSKIKIRKVILYHFHAGDSSFDSIRIERKQVDILSNIYSVLVFQPDSAYSIDYSQDIRFYKKTHYTIRARIKPSL